jgi:hypothetical protein
MYTLKLLTLVHWQWCSVWIREGRGGTCLEGGKGQQLHAEMEGGSTGGSLTKGTGARIPKAENERKRSRAQPPAAEQRMREEEAGNRWMKSWAMGSILLTLVDQITSPNAHLEV